MAEESTTNETTGTPDVPVVAPEPVETETETETESTDIQPPEQAVEEATTAPKDAPPDSTQQGDAPVKTAEAPDTPDEIQAYIDKAYETIQHEVEHQELDTFLRAHVKTFREEWDIWPDSAKDAYMHMMTSQLLQRKAAHTRIMNYEEFKLPVPSAQTKLFESIKQSQVKPQKCMPVLLLPPNLRPTYALKK